MVLIYHASLAKYQVKLGAYVNHSYPEWRIIAISSRARLGYEQHSRLEIGALLSSCILLGIVIGRKTT